MLEDQTHQTKARDIHHQLENDEFPSPFSLRSFGLPNRRCCCIDSISKPSSKMKSQPDVITDEHDLESGHDVMFKLGLKTYPRMTRPTNICARPKALTKRIVPTVMTAVPKRIVFFLPKRSPKVNAMIAPKKQPTL